MGVWGVLMLVEQLGERRLAAAFVPVGRDFFLRLKGVLGDLRQLLRELVAVDLPGLESVLQRIEPFRLLLEPGKGKSVRITR